jgi:hypothetical protein
MKFLILLACIAAASAVSSYYPWRFGGDSYTNKYTTPYYGQDYHKYDREVVGGGYGYGGLYNHFDKDFVGGQYNKDFVGGHYNKDLFYNRGLYNKDFVGGYGHGGFYGKKDFYGGLYNKDFQGYGHEDIYNFNIGHLLGDKDISVIKKDFVIVYYKYLLEILDLFKTRFGDILAHSDTFVLDKFTLPTHCTKLSGITRWMMTMSIDVTKYDIHFFDYYMMCKMYDYVMFIKYYFLHFDLAIMYKDYGMIQNFYGLTGDHGYGLYKYYGDVFGHDFYNYKTPFVGHVDKFVSKSYLL